MMKDIQQEVLNGNVNPYDLLATFISIIALYPNFFSKGLNSLIAVNMDLKIHIAPSLLLYELETSFLQPERLPIARLQHRCQIGLSLNFRQFTLTIRIRPPSKGPYSDNEIFIARSFSLPMPKKTH